MSAEDKHSPTLTIEEYRDFYDISRAFSARLDSGTLLFFDCPFDDELDEYSTFYNISVVTPATPLPRDWRQLNASGSTIGTIRTSEVRFDVTRRKEVQVPGLLEMIAAMSLC